MRLTKVLEMKNKDRRTQKRKGGLDPTAREHGRKTPTWGFSTDKNALYSLSVST